MFANILREDSELRLKWKAYLQSMTPTQVLEFKAFKEIFELRPEKVPTLAGNHLWSRCGQQVVHSKRAPTPSNMYLPWMSCWFEARSL